MSRDAHQEIVDDIAEAADTAVRALVTRPEGIGLALDAIERVAGLQERFENEFPALADAVEFWETLWLRTDRVRAQWHRIEKAAGRTGPEMLAQLQTALNERYGALYKWSRRFICERAPTRPTDAHFELGMDTRRPDCRGLHERIEGLYESIKRTGRYPAVADGWALPRERVNVGIIYGGGWNVSSFSVLREAARFPEMNAFVAFDHQGPDLFGRVGERVVRLATGGLMRRGEGEDEEYVLAAFREPVVLHFACPHDWTGRPPHELGLPILRSDLTLAIVNDKLNTTLALAWHAQASGADLPLIRERGIPQAPVPADPDALADDARAALESLQSEGVREVVVKPAFGEQAQGVEYFPLPDGRDAAAHAARLALESNVVIQERIRPRGDTDFNWRVLVALSPEGAPVVVGRFARKGRGDDVEMVADREMLAQAGVVGSEADSFLNRLNAVSLEAFRAVAGYAAETQPDFPWQPLGGGSYATPYFLGVDLIGDARIMEVNAHEVAGMWTDDRLYPGTRGRSNHTVLASALVAGNAYKAAIETRE